MVGRLCKQGTRGFEVLLMDLHVPQDSRLESFFVSSPDKEALNYLFEHPFRFLGKGGQSYAFISEDGKVVLKFFKKKHFLPDRVVEAVSSLLPNGLRRYRQKLLKTRKETFFNVFESCKIAQEKLFRETGLIYVHLTPTQGVWPKVELIDNLGISHWVDLDTTSFVVQKKADLIFDKIQEQFNQGDIEGVKRSIRSLFALISRRSFLGILDHDNNGLKRNYGYIGEEAVCIDVGGLEWDESLKERERAQQELRKKTEKLFQWIAEFHPEILPYCEERIVYPNNFKEVYSSA